MTDTLIEALLAIPTSRPRGDFGEVLSSHRVLLRMRGARMSTSPVTAWSMSAESVPPSGQAGLWYDDVALQSPNSARDVARQIARLCGDDSEVVTTWRSLADAVQTPDTLGRSTAYVQGGAEWLRVGGWLRWSVTDGNQRSMTTFQLLPGDDNWRGHRVKRTVPNP